MAGEQKKSPIDKLLEKNIQMAGSSSDGAGPSGTAGTSGTFLVPEPPTHIMLMRVQERSNSNNESKPGLEPPMKSWTRIVDERQKVQLLGSLLRLGLAPKKYTADGSSKYSGYKRRYRRPETSNFAINKRKRQIPRKALTEDDKQFIEPCVFECELCPKIFFMKKFYRRHTIKHLSESRCCYCGIPCEDTITVRRHQARCRNTY